MHLLCERAFVHLSEIGERRVEAHAGLDHECELVDEVRQFRVDSLGASRCRLAEEEARGQDSGRSEHEPEQDAACSVRDYETEREPCH